MYCIKIHGKIKKTAILLFLSFGFILIADATAAAQKRYYVYEDDPRVYSYRSDYAEGRRVARQYGYEDGLEDGGDAGRERDVYNPTNSGDWKKGTNGYEGEFGNKNLYRQAYRAAYLQGYRSGYRRYTDRIYIKKRNIRRRL